MDPLLMKKVVFAFFSGEATTIQRQYLRSWLADEANVETYYRYLDEWESLHPQLGINEQKAQQVFAAVLATPPGTAARPAALKTGRPNWFARWPVWSVAATVLLVSLMGAYLFRAPLLYKTYRTAYGQTAAYRLADGTAVVLNANSTLRVPRFGFGRDTRVVFLTGEGEFNVTHTPSHQRFIVKTADNFQVEVLGTEFVVYARERGKRVFLNKGKVKLALPQGQELYMKPGNVVTVGKSGQYQLRQAAPARPYNAWKNHWFAFDNTSLAEVAAQIRERFGVNVIVADSTLAQRRIAGSFKAEQADDLLQILTQLLNLTVIKTPEGIELRTPNSPPHV